MIRRARLLQIALNLVALALAGLMASAPVALGQTAYCGAVAPGNYSAGFNCAPSAGNPASLSVPANVQINAPTGADLRVLASNANASITAAGVNAVSTVAAPANGIHAQVTGASGNASVAFTAGNNAMTMGANGDNAVYVQSASTGAASITVSSGASLTITNNANTGIDRDGLEINGTGGANASIIHSGTGTITTANGSAMFVRAASGGNILVEVGDGVALSVSKPGAASNNAGIRTNNAGAGTTTIDSAASMQVSGTNAHGMFLQTTSGTIDIGNTGAITVGGLNGFGIRASGSAAANVVVDNSGAILTTGEGGHGIYLTSQGGDITVTNDATITVGSIGAVDGSRGININAFVGGNIGIYGTGDITTIGNAATTRGYAIIANATSGNIEVNYSGALTSSGNGAGGIRADAIVGDVSVTYSGDRIETFNQDANGIYASSRSATGTVDIIAAGTIVTHADNGGGEGSGSGAFGLQAISYGGDVSVSFDGPLIDVNGSGAAILAANAYFTGTGLGNVEVDNSGRLMVRGNQQQGIRTFTTAGAQTITNSGAIDTLGASNSQGIYALTNGAAAIDIDNDGAISTVGTNSSGIDAVSQGGGVLVDNGAFISAGWGTSAGVRLGGSTQTLANASSIGALSETAILADGGGYGGSVKIDNLGFVTGVVTASTSAVEMDNGGSWYLRNFADTDGDQQRDTLAVAASDFGTSGVNSIVNTGTLSLVDDGGAATILDSSGQYLPLGNANNAMALGSVAQGQILGLATFDNRGVIDLSTNSTAGDVLLITGGHTAGSDGGGVFVANGGTLVLDTVLDQGGPGSTSDVLVLDSTELGSGATGIVVRNTLGAGALTVDDGIALVEVLNASASSSGMFTLAAPAVAGPYDYLLYQGGEPLNGGDPADGNWYLRSTLNCDSGEPPDDCIPVIRPEVSVAAADPALALFYGRALLDTLHERIGERAPNLPIGANGPATEEVWGRVIGTTGRHQGDAEGVYGSGPSFDYTLGGLQAGVDLYEHTTTEADGQKSTYSGGIYGAIGQASAEVDHHILTLGDFRGGTASLNAFTLGGYFTRYGSEDWYVDGVVQGTFYALENDTRRGLATSSTSGIGLAASLEAGYPIHLAEDWILEPQVQAIAQQLTLDDFEDAGAEVSYSNTNALTGRLGVRLAHGFVVDQLPVTAWGRANLWHEFLGNSTTNFSSSDGDVPFTTDIRRTWLEVGVGADLPLNNGSTLYGSLNYNTSLTDSTTAWEGMVGARIQF